MSDENERMLNILTGELARALDGDDPESSNPLINRVLALTQGVERDIPNTNEGEMFLHCGLCLEERPPDQSPREWASLEVSWTTLGLQVWCKRHECNVIHVDFQNQKHPANTARKPDEIPDPLDGYLN